MSKYLANKKTKKIFNGNIPKYDNEIKEIKTSSYIVGFLNANQPISHGSQKLMISKAEIEGDYFKLDTTNYQIEVLKDCVALISGTNFVDGSTSDAYIWSHITLNNVNITSKLERILNKDFTQCSIPTIAKKLEAGDKISMTVEYASANGMPSIRNSKDNSFLSVVKI